MLVFENVSGRIQITKTVFVYFKKIMRLSIDKEEQIKSNISYITVCHDHPNQR